MGDRRRVLFVCVHNSARSQMAEAYLKELGGDRFEVESAGLEPGALNPVVVRVMKEEGIDISGNRADSVFEFFTQGRKYSYVITVCDESSGEKCPLFPGMTIRLHWSFEDPSAFAGPESEVLEKTRQVRNAIKSRVEEFVREAD
jgi:arsenate reductase